MKSIFLLVLSCFYALHLEAAAIRYDLLEEGEISGRRLKRFMAVNDDTNDENSDRSVTIHEWAEAIQNGDISNWNSVLQQAPYKAFYFEVIPVTRATAMSQPFEFVLVDAPSLVIRKPRFRSFQEPCGDLHNEQTEFGCVFPNLSGDALLIVPRPPAGMDDSSYAIPDDGVSRPYTHLANFVRQGPEEQVLALWKLVASQYRDRWNETNSRSDIENIWLSTCGHGVSWLHFRLDTTPKYYRYKPYKVPIVSHPADIVEEL